MTLLGRLNPWRKGGKASNKLDSEPSHAVSFPDGVKVLHDSEDAVIDICFVHGLTGNRESTWTARGQSKPWPAALLPPKLEGAARVLTYGYDAYVVQASSVASSNGLTEHAKNLLHDLTNNRRAANASNRPLVLVAHSLGGLISKEAVLLSREASQEQLESIFKCLRGIVFMGTPHRGSWMADWAKIPSSALGIVKSTNKSLLKILETDNTHLKSVQDRFETMILQQQRTGREIGIACFFEELGLSGVGKVVSQDSATFGGDTVVSIHANHSNMVKFQSDTDTGFTRLLGVLNGWMPQAGNTTDVDAVPPEEAQVEKPAILASNMGSGDQFNAPGGTQNISKGSGNHFPGANFSGNVTFGQTSS